MEENNDKKLIAETALKIKNSKKFGRIIPHLDSEYGAQMTVSSGKYKNLQYQFIVREHLIRLYVYLETGGKFRYINPTGQLDYDTEYKSLYEYFSFFGYTGFSEEYNLLSSFIGEKVKEEMVINVEKKEEKSDASVIFDSLFAERKESTEDLF